MVKSIWNDVRSAFSYGNMVTRLIIINVAIFVVLNIVRLFFILPNQGYEPQGYSDLIHFFCISSDWKYTLMHPWAVVTHMFLHTGFWHLLWNMLFLYWFGRILGDLLGNHHIFPTYLYGGLAGALVYMISAGFFPVGSFALGASAAVSAIMVAAAATAPNYNLTLILIGDVRLKYVVATLIFLDMISIGKDSNTGGHLAHLGGAFFGWFYVMQLRNGFDWSKGLNGFLDSVYDFFKNLFSTKKGPRVAYRNPDQKRSNRKGAAKSDNLSYQEKLDTILDKIKQNGYDSLSEEEKEFLFRASKQ